MAAVRSRGWASTCVSGTTCAFIVRRQRATFTAHSPGKSKIQLTSKRSSVRVMFTAPSPGESTNFEKGELCLQLIGYIKDQNSPHIEPI